MPILGDACDRILSKNNPTPPGPESENRTKKQFFRQSSEVGINNNRTEGDEEEYFAGKNIKQKLVFLDESYQDSLLSRLNTLRKTRELCDVVLFVDQKEIFAHRAVLASLSPVLYDLFTAGGGNQSHPLNFTNNGTTPATPFSSRETSQSKIQTNGHCDCGIESASSPPTFGLFKNDMSPGNENLLQNKTSVCGKDRNSDERMLYLDFNGVSYECFQTIVDYAYTAKLEICCGMVADLYKTACMLRVEECAKVCANYLADSLSPHNCIGVRRCANKTNDILLASLVDQYIQNNFVQIVNESKEFTSLPLVQVEVIWDGGVFRGEEDCKRLAEKVTQWFQTHEMPDNREFRMEELTQKVHLLHAGTDFVLQDCGDMDDLSSVGSSDLVQDYKKSYSKEKKKSTSPNGNGGPDTPVHGPSAQTSRANSITGGRNTQTSTRGLSRFSSTDSVNSSSSVADANEIEWTLIALTKPSPCYCIALAVLRRQLVAVSIQMIQNYELRPPIAEAEEERLSTDNGLLQPFGRIQIPAMNSPRCSVGAVEYKGKLFVCGGYSRGECMKTVEMYDPSTNGWTVMPSMLKERGRFDATWCEDKVYAIGGSDSKRDLDSAELFDPATERWSLLPRMNVAKSNNGCASVGGFVYCIGGWNGQKGIQLCERYSPEQNKWEIIAPLAVGRSQASCTSWSGGILAVGGCDGWQSTNTIEFYDPKTNTWKFLSAMTTPRRGCGVTVFKDKLYVAGGSDGQNSLNSVEILDLKAGTWIPGPPLTTPRANVRLVSVGELIFAIGGFNGKTFLSSVECLEPVSPHGWRTWVSMSSRSRQNSRTVATFNMDSELRQLELDRVLDALTVNDDDVIVDCAESSAEVGASDISSPGPMENSG